MLIFSQFPRLGRLLIRVNLSLRFCDTLAHFRIRKPLLPEEKKTDVEYQYYYKNGRHSLTIHWSPWYIHVPVAWILILAKAHVYLLGTPVYSLTWWRLGTIYSYDREALDCVVHAMGESLFTTFIFFAVVNVGVRFYSIVLQGLGTPFKALLCLLGWGCVAW